MKLLIPPWLLNRSESNLRAFNRTGSRSGSRSDLLDYEAELTNGNQDHLAECHTDEISEQLHAAWDWSRDLVGEQNGGMDGRAGRRLYTITRMIEPEVVIETGVAHGCSTSAILAGLERNGSGKLHSIGVPFRASDELEEHRRKTCQDFGGVEVPVGKEPGWIIPDEWRYRWTFHEGMSQRLLPELLAETGSVDLFVHDSEHSLPCTSFELEAAWARLTPGGVVVCDDISWSGAWEGFVEERVPDGYHGILCPDVGYAIKETEQQ